MTRREWLAGAAAAAVPHRVHGAATRPNIVVLLGDQLRAQAVGCLGDEQAQTPNIDRLAGEGVTLTNTFANTPVCCPARAAMLTGQYCHRNGMTANDLRLREDGVSFARILRDHGYRTGFVGKWHLDGGPREPGFVPPGPRRQGYDFWVAHECSHRHFNNTVFRDTPEPIQLGEFETTGYAKFAEEFLRGATTDKRPFYLTVQWGPPHDPYRAPEEWARRFDSAKLKLRPNWRAATGVPDRAAIAQYYAMTAALDDGIGRVLRAIDDAGARDNTIVLVTSDHGDMLGSQGERLKRKPWEESIRLPGIMRWPARLKPGSRPSTFFTHVDFAPTLLGLAGIDAPRAMQGTNLARAIAGEGRGQSSAFLQIFGPYAGTGLRQAGAPSERSDICTPATANSRGCSTTWSGIHTKCATWWGSGARAGCSPRWRRNSPAGWSRPAIAGSTTGRLPWRMEAASTKTAPITPSRSMSRLRRTERPRWRAGRAQWPRSEPIKIRP